MSLSNSVTFDSSDVKRFAETFKKFGPKAAKNAVKKGSQKGSNAIGKAIRKKAPKDTGQLKKGFVKKKEKSKSEYKFVYDYKPDPKKNDIFQKPIQEPGKYGGKSKHAYYPASVEYGFLTRAKGGKGYELVLPGGGGNRKTEGAHFMAEGFREAEPKARETMVKVFNEEIDKEWMK